MSGNRLRLGQVVLLVALVVALGGGCESGFTDRELRLDVRAVGVTVENRTAEPRGLVMITETTEASLLVPPFATLAEAVDNAPQPDRGFFPRRPGDRLWHVAIGDVVLAPAGGVLGTRGPLTTVASGHHPLAQSRLEVHVVIDEAGIRWRVTEP